MAGQVQGLEGAVEAHASGQELERPALLDLDMRERRAAVLCPRRLEDRGFLRLVVEVALPLRRRRHEHQGEIGMVSRRRLLRHAAAPRHHEQLQRLGQERALPAEHFPGRREQGLGERPGARRIDPDLQRPLRLRQPAVERAALVEPGEDLRADAPQRLFGAGRRGPAVPLCPVGKAGRNVRRRRRRPARKLGGRKRRPAALSLDPPPDLVAPDLDNQHQPRPPSKYPHHPEVPRRRINHRIIRRCPRKINRISTDPLSSRSAPPLPAGKSASAPGRIPDQIARAARTYPRRSS